jgi:hypothetical protein
VIVIVIDLVANATVWRVPGFEVDSFVHEVRALDLDLSARGKIDHSKAVFVCTIMPAVSHNSRLVFCFPSSFASPITNYVRSSWCMYVDEGVVEESAFYSLCAETLV